MQAAHLGVARADAPDTRPNVIVILADDLGYGDLSCYGNERFETPHLDRLAAGGLRLTDFHSASPVCSPTRAALLTGRYPQRAGIDGVVYAAPTRNRHHGLFPSELTVAELLRDAGYRTALVGKWHLGYQKRFNPVRHGFDLFHGYVSGNVDYFSHVDQEGFADWWFRDRQILEPGYSTHLITRVAVQFIEANRDTPFFLYIAHEAPHSPFQGPGDRAFRVAGRKVPPPMLSDAEKRRARREMILEMDRGVGDVIAALERSRLGKQTFVFFFSDNGATPLGSNGHLRGHKGSLWEGGHRVPAVAWWPGTIPAGRTDAQTTMAIDIMPTILDIAGVDVPPSASLDGVSLLPALKDGVPLDDRALFWEYREQRAMREGDWKLLTGLPKPGDVGLYNLGDDPGERRNVAAEFPDRAARMQASLELWAKEVRDGATRQPRRAEEVE